MNERFVYVHAPEPGLLRWIMLPAPTGWTEGPGRMEASGRPMKSKSQPRSAPVTVSRKRRR